LNLLRSDQSTLTIDQWNLLSNLSHCYDEHSGLLIGERFILDQTVLPIKLRFKCGAMFELIQMIVDGTQSLYKNNQDFISLCADDRSLLLHNTLAHTANISTNYVFYKVGLMNYPAYYNFVQTITHEDVLPAAMRIAGRLNFDIIVIKLFLAILSFSTIGYTVYSNSPPINLKNIKQILSIQNTYIELTWQYLIYKYNFQQTVKCFSDLIRCVFAIDEIIVKAREVQWAIDIFDSLIQQTEQTLNLND
jgi:hypothetical protein